jgi:tetratricopeptide (TPR) repeat protein
MSTFSFSRTLTILANLLLTFCLALSICASASSAQEIAPTENDAIELFNRGQEAHEKGDLRAALDLYEKALKVVADFPEAELQRGNALLGLGRTNDAESAFRKAVGLRDDWSLAYAYLGATLMRQQKFADAKPVLAKAIELDADNTPAWSSTAELAIRTKASEAELRAIHKKIAFFAAAAKPTVAILSAKASLEFALKDESAAAFSAKRALGVDANNLSMLVLVAEHSLNTKDLQTAEAYTKRIEAVDPKAAELNVLKVRMLLAAGKVKEASALIDADKNPSKELLDIKQKILAATETNVATLEKQLEAEPRNIVALERVCSLLRKEEPLRAMEFCKRALDVEPNNIDHAVGYAAAMLQAKQYPQASALLQKLVNLAPENQTIRANFATSLFQQKRYTEAKPQFIWLSEKQPANAVTYFFLAIAHDELGEYADAMANYQLFMKHADATVHKLEIEKVNLRLPTLQKQLDAGKGRNNAKSKSKT